MFNEVFSDIANRFQTWLQANNVGNLVVNNRKDYLNRAQRWLQIEKPWEGLVVDTSITINNGVASLPSDFISLIALGHSINSDGRIDWYYYRDSYGSSGYRPVSTFSKYSGQTWSLKFFTGYPYQPNICRYQKKLDDFVDTGVEYSFFPGELLLKVGQLLRIEDYEPEGRDYNTTKIAIDRLLKKYKNMEYQNNKMVFNTLDDNGNVLSFDSHSLDGSDISNYNSHNIGKDC